MQRTFAPHRLSWILLPLLLILSSCQSLLIPKGLGGHPAIQSGATGKAVTWAQLLAAADAADVILLGEQHTDAEGHAIQLELYRAILERQPATALSLEFLERDEQPLIERYRAGTLSREDFIALTNSRDASGTNTWVRWYQPLVDAAVQVNAPVYGANPPRFLAKLAREKGFDALRQLPPLEQPYLDLPTSQPTRREHRRFVNEMRDAARSHGAGLFARVSNQDAEPFLRAQELWNGTMSASILQAREQGAPKVVQVVGAFHIEEQGGIVRELKARQPGLKTLTILLDPNPRGRVRGKADFIVRTRSRAGTKRANAKPDPDAPKETIDPRLTVTLPSYLLAVSIEPTSHTLRGRVRLALPRTDLGTTIGLDLVPGLSIKDIRANGAVLSGYDDRSTTATGKDEPRYIVRLRATSTQPELFIWWEGAVFQDPQATEAAGQIHNLDMHASIDPFGIYLTGAWYPRIHGSTLAHYELTVKKLTGIELIASGQRDTSASQQLGSEVWYTNYPVQDYVLVGGPLKVTTRTWRDKEITVYLRPEQESQTEGLFEAIERNLERYEPLLGPLPVKQYRIVDNFFSSGYAFPGFTLLSSGVISMGSVSQKGHGYIDHELIHTWWGCGVQAREDEGNWSEALTSYCTNYYGYLLDRDTQGARKYRRDALQAFSKLSREQDVPLAWFGTHPDVSRIIGYNKGAVVFHLLERLIGEDAFFNALRQVTAQATGKQIGWTEFRQAFEVASKQDLEWFFAQWVDAAGAAELDLKDAMWSRGRQTLELTLEQPANVRVSVPVVIHDAQGSRTLEQDVQVGQQRIELSGIAQQPTNVALDPDFHVLRRIKPAEWVPTLDSTRRTPKLRVLVTEADRQTYAPFIELFSTPREAGQFRQGGDVAPANIGYLSPSDADAAWADAGVVIVGDAARRKAGRAILRQLPSPVKLLQDGFSVGGREYRDTNASLLATFAHPTRSGSGVTLILGNSATSLPKASNLPFYPNSVVVFENGRPVQRLDLEHAKLFPVTVND